MSLLGSDVPVNASSTLDGLSCIIKSYTETLLHLTVRILTWTTFVMWHVCI